MAAINLYSQLRQGWINLEEITLLIMNKYLPDRETYPDFERFLPVILEYLRAKSTGLPFDLGPSEEGFTPFYRSMSSAPGRAAKRSIVISHMDLKDLPSSRSWPIRRLARPCS